MAQDISSPFTPGLPVPVDFFVGRAQEIERLKGKCLSSQRGRLETAFLTGERGIGKSSLASFIRFVAERELNMIALHAFLGGATSSGEVVSRVFDRFLKEGVGTPWYAKLRDMFTRHIRQVDLFGIAVEFKPSEQDLDALTRNFAEALRNIAERIRDDKKGIVLVLDDINGIASSHEFANWLKSLVDEIATTRHTLPLCLLLVGLEERRQELIRAQPSLARVFDLVEIRPWSEEETTAFFRKEFASVGVGLAEEASAFLVTFAGGLPVLAHELGDAAFKLDTDKKVDVIDAAKAVLSAADIVGRKHLEPQVFATIRSPRYRSILRKLAQPEFGLTFQRSQVRQGLSGGEVKVLDNFLRRMLQLGVISRDPEHGAGAYRFTNRLHSLYFTMEARRAAGSTT